MISFTFNLQLWYFCDRRLWWFCECVGWKQQEEAVSGKQLLEVWWFLGELVRNFSFNMNIIMLSFGSTQSTQQALQHSHSAGMVDFWLWHQVTHLKREISRKNQSCLTSFSPLFPALTNCLRIVCSFLQTRTWCYICTEREWNWSQAKTKSLPKPSRIN